MASGKLHVMDINTDYITINSNAYAVNLKVADLCTIGKLVVEEYLNTTNIYVSNNATFTNIEASNIDVTNAITIYRN